MTELYFNHDHVLAVVQYDDPNPHRHHATHILVSLSDDICFNIRNKPITCSGIIISSNILHTAQNSSLKLGKANNGLAFLFDATSIISEKIHNKLGDSPYQILNSDVVDMIRNSYLKCPPEQNYRLFLKQVLDTCEIAISISKRDERVETILKLTQTLSEITEHTIKELSKLVHLSQSRLSHLFKEHTGVALSSYLVNLKMMRAFEYLYEGISITDAALKAGFSSASHFSATSQRMFGMTVKNMRSDMKFHFLE